VRRRRDLHGKVARHGLLRADCRTTHPLETRHASRQPPHGRLAARFRYRQGRFRPRGGAPDQGRRHRRHRRLRRHRFCREYCRCPRAALSRGERATARPRQPARPDAGLCGRAGRRQGARSQPLRPRRPGEAACRRSLGPGAKAAATGRGQSHRGLQPAAGGDHPPVPRHRRRQAGNDHPRRTRHFCRPAFRRRQAEREDDRRHRPPDGDRRRGIPVLQGFPDHVGIIRGTTADPDGNVTMERRR
jgi:hypothetical protein